MRQLVLPFIQVLEYSINWENAKWADQKTIKHQEYMVTVYITYSIVASEEEIMPYSFVFNLFEIELNITA